MSALNRNAPCPCGSGKKYKQCCLRRDEAIASGKRAEAVSIPGAFKEATEHHQAGRLSQAETLYRQILQIEPNHQDALNLLGVAAHQEGKHEIAVELIGRAIKVNPSEPLYYNNLGAALEGQGRLDEAVVCYLKALSINPGYAEAHHNLGIALKRQGKLDAAVEHYQQSLLLKPDYAVARISLGNALKDQGKLDEAINSYYQAILLKPDYAEAHNNIAIVQQEQGNLDASIDHCRLALSFKPDYAEAYSNLGNAFKDQGRLGEAVESFRKALSLKPDFADAYSNLLFALNFRPELRKEEVYREAQEYEARIGLPLRSSWRAHNNDRNPQRRLRVGYVSPDFRNHAVAYFAEPILANHDKSQIEVFCYAEVVREDEYTKRFRQLADRWYSTVGLSDDAVAQMIRDHQIDILVDLAGHTAKNRLLTFARKPAPIQVTYLGYPGTTGLSAMDYRITDHYADPEGVADAFYAERLLRLPDNLCCYRPSADMPEPSVLPALARGYLTFGSFNNFNKIDQPTLELWVELLRALPTSRLMLLTVPEGETRLRLGDRFAELGISVQRLEFHGKLPPAEFYRKFQEVDITLDPASVSGGTTTCESLWMGVPVIALAGERFITRVSYSFLNTAGLADFAAASPEDYVRIASHLADNFPLLAEIRAGLRAHVAASPLIDEAGFTRSLENLYRKIWEKWCSAT